METDKFGDTTHSLCTLLAIRQICFNVHKLAAGVFLELATAAFDLENSNYIELKVQIYRSTVQLLH